MATRRIKDITNTATTFASDDFIALDGSTQGTRKMDKDDLIAEVSAGVSGDYLEEANNLSDVASLDTSKLNMEIPDVGTAPNEVPLNGMLGDMAYQSSDGVSVASLEVTDKVTGTLDVEQSSGTLTTPASVTTLRVNNSGSASNNAAVTVTSGASGSSFVLLGDNENDDIGYIKYSNQYNQLQFATAATDRVTIDASGLVGIGTATPSSKLTVDSGNIQLQGNKPPNAEVYHINWKNTNSTGFDVARIAAATGTNIYEGELRFLTKDSGGTMATRWSINSSGNLRAGTGNGIDFGSGASTTLDAYEEGTWTPALTFGGGATGITYGGQFGYYTRIGDRVFVSGVITLTAVGSSTGTATITGLPEIASNATSNNRDNLTFSYAGGMTGLGGTVVGLVIANATTVNLYQWAASGTTAISNTAFTNSTTLRFNGQYHI